MLVAFIYYVHITNFQEGAPSVYLVVERPVLYHCFEKLIGDLSLRLKNAVAKQT